MEHIKNLYAHYRHHGLEVVCIHPAEFAFEKNPRNVKNALSRQKIYFPVIFDPRRNIIRKLQINFWPTHLLLCGRRILYTHIGEGGYHRLEAALRTYLHIKKNKPWIFKTEPRYSKFPCVYAGTKKQGIVKPLPKEMPLEFEFGTIYTTGAWKQTAEYIAPVGRGAHRIFIKTKGKILYCVAGKKTPSKKSPRIMVKHGRKILARITISQSDLYEIVAVQNRLPPTLSLGIEKNPENLALYSVNFQ